MATASTTMPTTALTMKLLIDSSPQRQRVVFAEAGKDTIDFLFSLLAIPAGTAVKLLGKDQSMVGCMGNLYSSAEKLDDPYVQPDVAKDAILCTTMAFPAAARPNSFLFSLPEPVSAPKKFYHCNTWIACRVNVTDVYGTPCANCGARMVTEANFLSPVAQGEAKKGFVQGGMVTYMVTDDLVISPMSNVSTIALLNACAVRDLGTLQERTVQIGYKEGLEILKASVQSKTVLNDVFIGKKPPSLGNGGASATLSNGRRRESLTWRA